MNNTRYATAIHILTLLANFPKEWLSSDFISESIHINPVIVRKELGILQNSAFVVSKKGKDGGYKLNKSPYEITMSEVYLTVKNSDILGKMNMNPNPKCIVGKDINIYLSKLFTDAEQLVADFLNGMTLEDFAKQFR